MEENELVLLEESKAYMASIAKTKKFFAVLFAIGLGIIILAGIGVTIYGMAAGGAQAAFGVAGIIYIIMAAIYIAPTLYLFRAAKAAKQTVENNDNAQLEEYLKNSKSYWKFMGIYTIVCLSLCVLLGGVGFAVGAAAGMGAI